MKPDPQRLRGRVIASDGEHPSIALADVRVEVSGRPPYARRVRAWLTLQLDSGSSVRVSTTDAALEVEAATARGPWERLASTEVGALASDLGAGPHVDATLIGRVVRVGDRVEVEGTPMPDESSGYRSARSLCATRVAAETRGSTPRASRRRELGSVLFSVGALLCLAWGIGVGVTGLLWARTPVEVAMRGAAVTAMAVLALELLRRGRGYLHMLPGPARRSWLPQLRAHGGAAREVVTDAGERSALVAALLALNGPLAGMCFLAPDERLREWGAEAGVVLFLPSLLSFVLLAVVAHPSAHDRRDARLASAMLRAIAGSGPWAAVTGSLGAGAAIRRRIDGWVSTSGTRYTVVRTVLAEEVEAPASIAVTTEGGAVNVQLSEAVFASTRCERLASGELRQRREDDDRAFTVEWRAEPGMRVLATGTPRGDQIVARGPESVAVLATDGADPKGVLRRGLMAIAAPRVVLVAGLVLTATAVIVAGLSAS